MKKLLLFFFIIFAGCALGISAEETRPQPPSEEEILRQQIIEIMERINKNSEAAQTAYREVTAAAEALRLETEQRLKNLDDTIKAAQESKLVNRDLLKQAQGMQRNAQAQFRAKNYREALATANSAFEFITDVPLVSTTLQPRLFSPDGDGVNDDLLFETSVRAKNPISNWELRIMRSEPGDVDIEVFRTGGKGVPDRYIWKGTRDGKVVVDSATNYYAELYVIDEKGGRGESGRLNFKTDIFVNRTERGMMIDITSIKFEPDKSVLLEENYPIIQTIRQFLLKYPEYRVVVEGHAHFSGPAAWSYTLSQRRAQAVADYLISLGMEKDRLIVQGMGEALPRTFEAGEDPLNRRVSFILIRSEEELEAYHKFVKTINFKKEVTAPKKK